jgi:hypothetical protein
LVGNGVGFWPLSKIVHRDAEVSVPLVTLREESCYTDGYPFESGPNIVLIHMATSPGSQASGGCTGVTVLAPFLNIVSCLKPVVPLFDLVQGLVNTQVSSLGSTMEFSQYFFHSRLREDYLSYYRSYIGGLPVKLR